MSITNRYTSTGFVPVATSNVKSASGASCSSGAGSASGASSASMAPTATSGVATRGSVTYTAQAPQTQMTATGPLECHDSIFDRNYYYDGSKGYGATQFGPWFDSLSELRDSWYNISSDASNASLGITPTPTLTPTLTPTPTISSGLYDGITSSDDIKLPGPFKTFDELANLAKNNITVNDSQVMVNFTQNGQQYSVGLGLFKTKQYKNERFYKEEATGIYLSVRMPLYRN